MLKFVPVWACGKVKNLLMMFSVSAFCVLHSDKVKVKVKLKLKLKLV